MTADSSRQYHRAQSQGVTARVLRRVGPSYQQVAEQLQDLILRGVFAPGSRLPDETRLAGLFGVGRSTVREALRILSAQGLVVITRGSKGGAFVVQPSAQLLGDQLEAVLSLLASNRLVGVDQVVEAREVLEVPAAYMAATRRREEHLAALRGCLFPEEPRLPMPEVYQSNFRFHLTVVEAADNPILRAMTVPLFAVLQSRYLRDRAPWEFWLQVLADHRRILAALEDGDAEAAARAMRDHMERIRPTYQLIAREVEGPDGPAGAAALGAAPVPGGLL